MGGANGKSDASQPSGAITDDSFWHEIVFRGIESEELDYKAAQNWQALSRTGKAKFVRHCTALANTKGGYIVVGVGEDRAGKPALFTGMTEPQTKSFDPTDFGSFMHSFMEPPVDFEIKRPTIDGKTYVIIVVRRFKDLPHVCSHNCEHELQQGAFYIRTIDASSRVAYRASELHGLIQRSLRNQRELLGRLLRGILYESGQAPKPLAESRFNEQLRHAQAFLNRDVGKVLRSGPRFDFACYLPDFTDGHYSLQEVKRCALESAYTFRGTPLVDVGDGDDTYFTNVSLRSLAADGRSYWQAFQSGLFHCCHALPVKDGVLDYDDLVHLITETVFFLGQYYTNLVEGDDILTLSLWFQGVEGVNLRLDGGGENLDSVCRIPEIRISIKRTGADLASGVVGHATRLIRDICMRFNLPEGRHTNLQKLISDHLDLRV